MQARNASSQVMAACWVPSIHAVAICPGGHIAPYQKSWHGVAGDAVTEILDRKCASQKNAAADIYRLGQLTHESISGCCRL